MRCVTTISPTRGYRLAADPRVRIAVASVGLACCAMEVDEALRRGLLVPDEQAGAAGGRSFLLVAGTVTDALVPVVRSLLAAAPDGTQVVSFGACAATGGPYWDAPTVAKGVDQFVPVARYVPGCPPRPESLVEGLLALVEGAP